MGVLNLQIWLCIALGGSLIGCQSLSPERGDFDEASIRIPEAWAETKEGKSGVDNKWLQSFGSKELESYIEEALANNEDLMIASIRVKMAEKDAGLAGVSRRPTLTLNGNGSRASQNFVGSPFSSVFSPDGSRPDEVSSVINNSFGVSLDVNWELDIWGRARAGQSAIVALGESITYEEQAARVSLCAQVAKSYFSLLEAQEQLAIERDNLKIADSTKNLIRDRYEYGDENSGGISQLRIAESDYEVINASIAERSNMVSQQSRQLERLLGRTPQGKLRAKDKLIRLTKAVPAGVPSSLLQRRPDILAAERRWASQKARVKEAKLAVFPRLALTASGGTSTDQLKQILNRDFSVWSLAGNLVQPIITGGQLKLEKSKRELENEESMLNLKKTVYGAFLEVEDAISSGRSLGRQVASNLKARDLAKDSVELARDEYSSGTGEVLTLLSAQSRLIQLRSRLAILKSAELMNRVNLHLALGGDFKNRGKQSR